MAGQSQSQLISKTFGGRNVQSFGRSRTRKDPFKNGIDIPDGTYFAQVRGAALTSRGKGDKATTLCIIKLVGICDAEGNLEVTEEKSGEVKSVQGAKLELTSFLKATEKRTMEEAIDSMMFSFQSIGFNTAKCALDQNELDADESGLLEFTLEEMLEQCAVAVPVVIVTISTTGKYRNVRVDEVQQDVDYLTQITGYDLSEIGVLESGVVEAASDEGTYEEEGEYEDDGSEYEEGSEEYEDDGSEGEYEEETTADDGGEEYEEYEEEEPAPTPKPTRKKVATRQPPQRKKAAKKKAVRKKAARKKAAPRR